VTARLSKLIVQRMFAVKWSVSCDVTRSPVEEESLGEQRDCEHARPSCIIGSNSDYRPMQINQLQSAKFV